MNSKKLMLFAMIFCAQGLIAQNLTLRSQSNYQVDLSDVWGWTDGTNEYALLGLSNAFTVVDVTDPDNPVKLFNTSVSGPRTAWRDIKTWGNFAYGVHDCPCQGSNSQGLVIMDLSYLPDSMPATFWTGEAGGPQFTEAHNIYIDEQGYAYLAGHNAGGSGVLILDLNGDPRQPTLVGHYQNGYVHDLFARNDTLWTSDGSISFGGAGQKRFSAVDISDRASPVLLGSGATPGGYSHNIWPSDDGKTVFTTDESSGAFIAAHDVSDVTDIEEIDRYRSHPGSGVIPHNLFVLNDFIVISYYRDGIIVLDASLPDELVEVGAYDTSPSLWGSGYNGAWGVYPYLPSGNILASDIENGLFVLTPNYVRAVHIRGKVTDAATGTSLSGADVTITRTADTTGLSTDLSGEFRKGFAEGGIFTISVKLNGYTTYTDTRALTNGDVLELDIALNALNYLGNVVWNDLNENGLQDPGEPGIAQTMVKLCDDQGSELASVFTDATGAYRFASVAANSYILKFIPPDLPDTRYVPTLPDAGDETIDSDIQKIDGVYATNAFALTATGSFLDFDAGFRLVPQTDPVDTIEVILGPAQEVTVCDDALENGVLQADTAYLCSPGAQGNTTWEAGNAGCLTVSAGNPTIEPIEVCVVTVDADGIHMDTTIYLITVDEALAVEVNGFENGALTLVQNPVNHILYVRNQMPKRIPLNVMISDLKGREIMRFTDSGFNNLVSLRVTSLSAGLYILSIDDGDQRVGVTRFVKR